LGQLEVEIAANDSINHERHLMQRWGESTEQWVFIL